VVVGGTSAADIPRISRAITAHWLKLPTHPLSCRPCKCPNFLILCDHRSSQGACDGRQQRGLTCTYGSPTHQCRASNLRSGSAAISNKLRLTLVLFIVLPHFTKNGRTVQDTIFNLQYVQFMPIRSLRHQLIPTFTDPLKSAA
jgi:hypothetical protein